MGFWHRRANEPLGTTHFQWANRASRFGDPFFWLAFLPLAAVLAFLAYGLHVYHPSKGVAVILLVLAGVAAIQFIQQWLLHYENFSVTDKGLVRAFPQREHLGPIRLMKPLQWLWARLRYVRWTEIGSVRARGEWIILEKSDGASARIRLRPLRLVEPNRSVGVAQKKHGAAGGGISEAEARLIVARQLDLALRRWGRQQRARELESGQKARPPDLR